MENAAKKAGLSADEISTQLSAAVLGDEQKEMVAELAPYVLEEWGLDANVSPSIAVLLVLAPWAFGSWTAYNALARLAEEREKATPKN